MRQYTPSLKTPYAVIIRVVDSVESSELEYTIGQFKEADEANQLVDTILSGGVISKIRIHKVEKFGINEEGRTWMYGEYIRVEGDWTEDE